MAESGLGVPLPLSGETRLYAVVGDPIRQVGAPGIFNRIFREAGVRAVLIPVQVAAGDFAAWFAAAKVTLNLDGYLATMPHKLEAARLADELSETARRVGAANVFRRASEGRWIGHHTDGLGCVGGSDGFSSQNFTNTRPPCAAPARPTTSPPAYSAAKASTAKTNSPAQASTNKLQRNCPLRESRGRHPSGKGSGGLS